MLKTFILAAVAVIALPLSQKFPKSFGNIESRAENTIALFPYKNTITTNLFEFKKKPTEAWSRNWYAKAQENIRKSEYNFKWENKLNAYCTPNRKNNLRFFYTGKGFSVEPRTTKISIGDFDPFQTPDKIKYQYLPNQPTRQAGWKIKFNLDKKQVGKGLWKVVESKAEYITNKITVQYINNDEGMRQNFIVHQPLSKKNDLQVNFSIKTKLKSKLSGNQIKFFHKKNNVLNYGDLKVWDATGKILPASLQKNKNRYFIKVETKNAVYPITIDPLSTTPSAILESNQVNANLGYAVASAGDVNGDGYSDVIAGAHGFDNGQTDEGAAFIYHGSATGVSTTAALFVESNVAGARLGLSVSTAGDVNGDGYSDIIVGAGLYSNGQSMEGAAFIYHGSAAGISTAAAIRLESNQINAQMGLSNSVACAGDVNGDGYSDVIVGAWLYDDGEANEGVAFVYHGSASGVSGAIATTLQANQAAANFGLAVAGAGDVNGDGYNDVIVGAENYNNGQTEEGVVFIYHGSASGINNVAVTMAESDQGFSQYGYAVASAGDVNGDGYSDVIVGAYTFDNGEINEGAAFIYNGSAAGIVNTISATLQSNQVGAQLGLSVAGAGDVNADGYSDVIAGANLYDNVQTSEGAAFVFFGSAAGVNTTATILESNQANAEMGRGVASAGDVNGDGYSDVIAGANAYNGGQATEGGAFVYHGSAAGLSATPNNIMDDADQAEAIFGVSVASAGDVNGDGYGDVIIGANSYNDGPNTYEGRVFVYHGSVAGLSATPNSIHQDGNEASAFFGNSVACAGDVNSDGYSDVIVGAFGCDDGANINEGKAFVYHGSAAGLSATPNSTPDDANQANSNFGQTVASAGDVNGDGYSDVIIGAPIYNDGGITEGRVFVYHGSAAGLSASPASTPDDANQTGAQFGHSLGSAGDVNGDGYSDVIIGAYLYDDGFTNEGRGFVYHGSASGLTANPNTILDDANMAQASFGESVSGAGDVNGDGYSDVIVGATGYTSGANVSEGRAYVYHGSAAGITAGPNLILDDTNQAYSYYGNSVSGAGDVNGDGYSDVIVGASGYNDAGNNSEGRAFVYYGSAAGLFATPGSTPDDADQPSAALGFSVACAGDINGDGYSDLIVGAYSYDDGALTNEGRAFLYNGNESTTNKRNNLRLYNTDLVTPINSSNFLFSNFGAGLYAKSFMGRSKGKLVWETRLNYNPYSGNPITNSTFFTTQQSSYTDMGLTGVELKSIIDKVSGASRSTKVRARVKYDPVTAITGQVYAPWRQASAVIDGNSLGALPIELISFNAAWLQKGKTARLYFKTDKESAVCCFDIEKSSDGFTFYSIATLPAKNVSGIQSYSFIDVNATAKKQLYRIKIKGIAGQVDYSNMQHLSAGSFGQNDKATEILVFPNPTTDVLQLQLNKVYDKMNVQIVNSNGQILKQLSISSSNQTITIPVQNLAAGKYWLRLQSGTEMQVLQFVKQ